MIIDKILYTAPKSVETKHAKLASTEPSQVEQSDKYVEAKSQPLLNNYEHVAILRYPFKGNIMKQGIIE